MTSTSQEIIGLHGRYLRKYPKAICYRILRKTPANPLMPKSLLIYHLFKHLSSICEKKIIFFSRLIGQAGVEPATSWSRTKRATNCATARIPLSGQHTQNRGNVSSPLGINQVFLVTAHWRHPKGCLTITPNRGIFWRYEVRHLSSTPLNGVLQILGSDGA